MTINANTVTSTVPIVMGPQGAQQTPPATLLGNLIAYAKANSPGYTASLPGSLVEDISSTDVGALVQMDSALVDLINSITPYGANAFILNQLGQVYGVQQGIGSNTSVFVTFTGTPGFVIPAGFVVGDGANQYVIQNGGAIGSAIPGFTTGQSAALYAVSTTPGSFAVPAGTVTALITSVPNTIALSCTNLLAGSPGLTAQPLSSYQAQVIQAGLATAQGVPNFIKTALQNVTGVQSNLISIVSTGVYQWMVICGGSGDPYKIGGALFLSLPDISVLTGSVLGIVNITQANPAAVTTTIKHGFLTGQIVEPSAIVGMTELNGNTYTATVTGPASFTLNVNSTGFSPYIGGGVISPNLHNVSVTINDYPDLYDIPFVVPFSQAVNITLQWNTTQTNLVSSEAVSALGLPALINYVNSVFVGAPMNLFEMGSLFQKAVSSIIPTACLSTMLWTVEIDGVEVSPVADTGLVYGDPQSYFSVSVITIEQFV